MSVAKSRNILFAIFAILAINAVTSASAFAAKCEKKTGSGKHVLCVGKELELFVSSAMINVADDTTHDYVLSASGVSILCTTVKTPATGNKSKIEGAAEVVKLKELVLEFSGCTVSAPANCKVKEAIVTEKLEGKALAASEVLFFPEAKGTTFATLTLENNGGICTIAGKDKVTTEGKKAEVGPQCVAPNIELESAFDQLFECKGAKSHLEFINKPAEFSGRFLALFLLAGGVEDLWMIEEGS
jgi:hypothetical protein